MNNIKEFNEYIQELKYIKILYENKEYEKSLEKFKSINKEKKFPDLNNIKTDKLEQIKLISYINGSLINTIRLYKIYLNEKNIKNDYEDLEYISSQTSEQKNIDNIDKVLKEYEKNKENRNSFSIKIKELKERLVNKYNKIQEKVNDFQNSNIFTTLISISGILALVTNIDILNSPMNLLNYRDFLLSNIIQGLGYGLLGSISLLSIFNKINEKFAETILISTTTSISSVILPLIVTIGINPNISNINNNNFLSQKLVIAEMYSQGSAKTNSINKYLENNFDYKTLVSSLFDKTKSSINLDGNLINLEILNKIINAKLIQSPDKNYNEILDQILKPLKNLKDGQGIGIKESIKGELSLIKIYDEIIYKITNMNEEQKSQYTIDKLFQDVENLLKTNNIHNFQDKKIIKLIEKYKEKTHNGFEIESLYKHIKRLHNNVRVQEIVSQSQELNN